MFAYFNQFQKVPPQKGFTTIQFASRSSLARSRVGVLENKSVSLSEKVSLDGKADLDTASAARPSEGPVTAYKSAKYNIERVNAMELGYIDHVATAIYTAIYCTDYG